MERLNVVPALLQEGDQEVDSDQEVGLDVLSGHVVVTDGGAQADDLLELELALGLEVLDLALEGFVVGDDLGEAADTGEPGTGDGGELLHEGVGGDEDVVLLGPALNGLLLLVEFLEVIDGDGVDAETLSLLQMGGVTDEADLHAGAGNVGEADGAGEALILGGVVILKTDLEFDGFLELTLFALGQNLGNSLKHLSLGNLGAARNKKEDATYLISSLSFKN